MSKNLETIQNVEKIPGIISGSLDVTFSNTGTGILATNIQDAIAELDNTRLTANSTITAGTGTKVSYDSKGLVTSSTSLSASDIPSLDASKITSGTIDAARLPSYVDDVIEHVNLTSFPTTGETGKIYVALDTNKAYRWSGSAYVYITSGAVDSVAGKTGVVTLVKGDVGLGNVDNTSDANKPVSTATSTVLGTKIDKVTSTDNAIVRFDGTSGAVQNSSVVIDDSGNVGIGTSSPSYKLEANGGAIGMIVGAGSDSPNSGKGLWTIPDKVSYSGFTWQLGASNSANLLIGNGSGWIERLRIDSSGNVGIGVIPSNWSASFKSIELPHGVSKSAYLGFPASVDSTNAYFDGASWKYNVNGYALQFAHNDGNTGSFKWFTAPSGTAGNAITFTQVMTLDAVGNLGIGTSSPSSKLSIISPVNARGISIQNLQNNSASYLTFRDEVGNESGWIGNTATTTGASNTIIIGTNGSERLRIDSSGNVGIGVTPSAWGSGYKNIEMGVVSSFGDYSSGGYYLTQIRNNAYENSGWKYKQSGYASMYQQDSGKHTWNTAPSGTAGNAITWTQAMTLASSGNLLVGTTTDNGVDKLQVNGGISARQINTYPLPSIANNNTTGWWKLGTILNSIPTYGGNVEIIIRAGLGYNGVRGQRVFGKILFRWGFPGVVEASAEFSEGNIGIGFTAINSASVVDIYANLDGIVWLEGQSYSVTHYSKGTTEYVHGLVNSGSPSTVVQSAVVLSTSNNVLIGTTADNGVDKLQVNGSIKSTAGLFTNGNVGVERTTAAINQGVGQGTFLQLSNSGDNNHSIIQQSLGDLQFINYTGGSWYEGARLTKGGNLLVGTSVDNGVDKLQVNGSLSISNLIGSSTSLYQSGESPAYITDGTNSLLIGTWIWTRIGKVVTASINELYLPSSVSGFNTSQLTISGLPFSLRRRNFGIIGSSPAGVFTGVSTLFIAGDDSMTSLFLISKDNTNNTYFHMTKNNIAISSGVLVYGASITYNSI